CAPVGGISARSVPAEAVTAGPGVGMAADGAAARPYADGCGRPESVSAGITGMLRVAGGAGIVRVEGGTGSGRPTGVLPLNPFSIATRNSRALCKRYAGFFARSRER